MPADVEKVQPPVVVRVKKAASPNNILRMDAETHFHTNVFEKSVAHVAVKVRDIIREVTFEYIKKPVTIVIANRESHS